MIVNRVEKKKWGIMFVSVEEVFIKEKIDELI